MRKTIIYSPLLLPLMALSLAACASDDDGMANGQSGDIMTMTATLGTDMGASRDGSATTRGTIDATWAGTEKLAVSMSSTTPNADPEGAPVVTDFCTPRCYTVNTGGKLTHTADTESNPADTEAFKWPGGASAVTFHGWHYAHEYRTEVNGVDFTVPTDQSTAAKIQDADFLYAPDVTLTDKFSAANLVCWHQFCLVDVYVASAKQNFLTETTGITMLSTDWVQTSRYTEPTGDGKYYGDWSSFTDENNTNLATPITPLRLEDTNEIHVRALVMPQLTSGKRLIQLTYGGVTYSYNLPNQHLSWMPGMKYTYRLWLGDDLFNVTAVPWVNTPTPDGTTTTSDPWNPDDIKGIFAVDLEPWDPISDFGSIVNLNPWMSGGKSVITDPDLWKEFVESYVQADPELWQELNDGVVNTTIEDWLLKNSGQILTTVAVWEKDDKGQPKIVLDPQPWILDEDNQIPDSIWAIITDWQQENENGTLGVLFRDAQHQRDAQGFAGGKPSGNEGTTKVEIQPTYTPPDNIHPTGYILKIIYPDGRTVIRTISGSQMGTETQSASN